MTRVRGTKPGKGFAREPGTAEDERRLVEEARRGDSRALRMLLERVSPPIYRFGRSFCRDSDDAEDVLQEVLVSLVRSLPGFRGDASLTTWAYTVARRACRRQRLRQARSALRPQRSPGPDGHAAAAMNGSPADVADPGVDLERDAERGEIRAALRAALFELPPAYREAVILRDLEGLPAREAARVLGVGERALKSRLHRARLALKSALAPRFSPEAAPGSRARDCAEAGRAMNRYLDGVIDARACAAMRAHMRSCESCGDACRALQRALRLCGTKRERAIPRAAREPLRRAVRAAVLEISASGKAPATAPRP
jgi:RNA polymerase sigma-70 factor (ECF subfamily)